MFARENHVVTMNAFEMVAQAKHIRNRRMIVGSECSRIFPNWKHDSFRLLYEMREIFINRDDPEDDLPSE